MNNIYECVVGKSNDEDITIDVLKYPNLLVVGTTGSGKSVFIESLIASLLNKYDKKELNLALIDIKLVEFSIFKNSKYLYEDALKGSIGLANDENEALFLINSLFHEAELRKKMFKTNNVKDFEEFNKNVKKREDLLTYHKLPLILLVVDEFVDLNYLNNKNKISTKLEELLTIIEGTGIVAIVSSQSPKKDIFSKSFMDLFHIHVCFRLVTSRDSNLLLGNNDAIKLMGEGDGIIYNKKTNVKSHFQSSYISWDDLKEIIIRRNY